MSDHKGPPGYVPLTIHELGDGHSNGRSQGRSRHERGGNERGGHNGRGPSRGGEQRGGPRNGRNNNGHRQSMDSRGPAPRGEGVYSGRTSEYRDSEDSHDGELDMNNSGPQGRGGRSGGDFNGNPNIQDSGNGSHNAQGMDDERRGNFSDRNGSERSFSDRGERGNGGSQDRQNRGPSRGPSRGRPDSFDRGRSSRGPTRNSDRGTRRSEPVRAADSESENNGADYQMRSSQLDETRTEEIAETVAPRTRAPQTRNARSRSAGTKDGTERVRSRGLRFGGEKGDSEGNPGTSAMDVGEDE